MIYCGYPQFLQINIGITPYIKSLYFSALVFLTHPNLLTYRRAVLHIYSSLHPLVSQNVSSHPYRNFKKGQFLNLRYSINIQ